MINTGTLFLPDTVTCPWDASWKFAGYGSGVSYPVESIDTVYAASLPPPVEAVYVMPQGVARIAAAVALSQQGFPIDLEIIGGLSGETPTLINFLRIQDGYTYVLPAGTPNPYAPPGDLVPGMLVYAPQQPWPAGAMAISLRASAYPPFAHPTPPPPVTSSLVGPFEATTVQMNIPGPVQGVYVASKGVVLPSGFPYTDPVSGKSFTFYAGGDFFGVPSYFWLGPLPPS